MDEFIKKHVPQTVQTVESVTTVTIENGGAPKIKEETKTTQKTTQPNPANHLLGPIGNIAGASK